MQPQSNTEYKQLLSDVIKKQIVILGPDITLAKARNVKGLVVSDDGTVTEITGAPQEITQNLIDQFVQLSGLIVKKTMEPLLSYRPDGPVSPTPTAPSAQTSTPTPTETPITPPVTPPTQTPPVQPTAQMPEPSTPIPSPQPSPVTPPITEQTPPQLATPPTPASVEQTPPVQNPTSSSMNSAMQNPTPTNSPVESPLIKDSTPGGPPPMDAAMIQEQIDQITKGGPTQ